MYGKTIAERMLEFLRKYEGQVVSHSLLLRKKGIDGEPTEKQLNALYAQIYTMRSMLEPDERIDSVRNVGYMLIKHDPTKFSAEFE